MYLYTNVTAIEQSVSTSVSGLLAVQVQATNPCGTCCCRTSLAASSKVCPAACNCAKAPSTVCGITFHGHAATRYPSSPPGRHKEYFSTKFDKLIKY